MPTAQHFDFAHSNISINLQWSNFHWLVPALVKKYKCKCASSQHSAHNHTQLRDQDLGKAMRFNQRTQWEHRSLAGNPGTWQTWPITEYSLFVIFFLGCNFWGRRTDLFKDCLKIFQTNLHLPEQIETKLLWTDNLRNTNQSHLYKTVASCQKPSAGTGNTQNTQPCTALLFGTP